MCGIIGGFDRDGRPFGETIANRGCARIAHRGPDDQGTFEADGIFLGNRRLAILDLDGGHQPMISDDGQIAVVQNGEIYNYLELARGLGCRTNCDTEVILRLYERDGEDFVRHLNGMFAIAVLDRRKRRLLLYRDRLGKKPLYLHDDGRRLFFASEIKAFQAMGCPLSWNWRALDAYLTYNYVPPPLTIFEQVRHLPPGHFLCLDERGCRERPYWQLSGTPEERSPEGWQDEIIETLRDAVRIRLRSDVPLGAFLSGGIDSSLIVRCMSDYLSQPVRSFCIGVPHAGFDDSAYASKVAALTGADHVCQVVQPDLAASWPQAVYHCDQPHGDASFLPMLWVSRLARERVKVALSGDGGDELFAGYDHHRRFLEAENLWDSPAERVRAYVHSNSIFDEVSKNLLYTASARQAVAGCDAASLALDQISEFDHQDPTNQVLGIDLRVLLPGNNLVKPDKMSMAVSLETRSPFLDYRLVELAFRIPGSLKLRHGETKSILKLAAERLLPREIVYRKKQMFTVPVGDWFKSSLFPLVQDTLLSPRARGRGLFEPRRVSAMVQEHLSGRIDHTRRIRALIALELWQRLFLDQSARDPPDLAVLGVGEGWCAPVALAS